MKKRELFYRLQEIDNIVKKYFSADRNGPYIADEMYLNLLAMYLKDKDSIDKDTLYMFHNRLSSRKTEYFTSLIVTNEIRIMSEIANIDRKLNEWDRKLEFVKLPFECSEFHDFPYGISKCIDDSSKHEDYSLDTLIRTITTFVTTDSTQKYPLYKALFFYLTNASRGKYIEYLEYLCKDVSCKAFFRRLFEETSAYIATTSYVDESTHLKTKREELTKELSAMNEEKKKTVCSIYVGGRAKKVI